MQELCLQPGQPVLRSALFTLFLDADKCADCHDGKKDAPEDQFPFRRVGEIVWQNADAFVPKRQDGQFYADPADNDECCRFKLRVVR